MLIRSVHIHALIEQPLTYCPHALPGADSKGFPEDRVSSDEIHPSHELVETGLASGPNRREYVIAQRHSTFKLADVEDEIG